MSDVDEAIKACTFGRFHYRLLLASLLAYTAGILVTSTTGYLLPVAECDLNMNLVQKGTLTAVAFFGMLLSTVIAGFLTDTFGRKRFVLIGLSGDFILTLVSGFSQSYRVLVMSKFFEGLFLATFFSAAVALTSEFCHEGNRDRVMLLQSSFTAISHIVIAVVSWAILIQEWKLSMFGGKFVLNIWNFYLYITSLWSLAACVLYWFIPESPKYLVYQKRYDEARDILVRIYTENTGKPAETYSHINIWKEESKTTIQEIRKRELRRQLASGLQNIKPIFKKPLVLILGKICLMTVVILPTYNLLRLWFPQLSSVIEHYPFEDNNDFCDVIDTYIDDLRLINTTESEVCVPIKSGNETYLNNLIIGCACLLPYVVTGTLVNRVGKKALLTVSGLLSVASCFGLLWASTKAIVVALFSAGIAIMQIMLSLNQAVTVELFPTTTRTLALSLILMIGRCGTLVYNMTFPVLLNMQCVVPFYVMSALLACVTIIALFLPTK